MPLDRVETVTAEGPGAAHNHVVSGDRALLRAPHRVAGRSRPALLHSHAPPVQSSTIGFQFTSLSSSPVQTAQNFGSADLGRCSGSNSRISSNDPPAKPGAFGVSRSKRLDGAEAAPGAP
jgi:hypothetical protein